VGCAAAAGPRPKGAGTRGGGREAEVGPLLLVGFKQEQAKKEGGKERGKEILFIYYTPKFDLLF